MFRCTIRVPIIIQRARDKNLFDVWFVVRELLSGWKCCFPLSLSLILFLANVASLFLLSRDKPDRLTARDDKDARYLSRTPAAFTGHRCTPIKRRIWFRLRSLVQNTYTVKAATGIRFQKLNAVVSKTNFKFCLDLQSPASSVETVFRVLGCRKRLKSSQRSTSLFQIYKITSFTVPPPAHPLAHSRN